MLKETEFYKAEIYGSVYNVWTKISAFGNKDEVNSEHLLL